MWSPVDDVRDPTGCLHGPAEVWVGHLGHGATDGWRDVKPCTALAHELLDLADRRLHHALLPRLPCNIQHLRLAQGLRELCGPGLLHFLLPSTAGTLRL